MTNENIIRDNDIVSVLNRTITMVSRYQPLNRRARGKRNIENYLSREKTQKLLQRLNTLYYYYLNISVH